jgi:hypothetical protein
MSLIIFYNLDSIMVITIDCKSFNIGSNPIPYFYNKIFIIYNKVVKSGRKVRRCFLIAICVGSSPISTFYYIVR